MKAKVVVSLGAVVGLAVLSAVAFISTADTTSARAAAGQREDSKITICQEMPAIKEKRGHLPAESIPLPEPVAEPLQTGSEVQSPEDSYLLAKVAMAEPDADCWQALCLIELDGWDESMGATYFESESESSWHEENLEFLFQHGNHYFYTDKEGEK